jgi:glyceraldehyde 3-phosphate dehydrogenase
MSYSPGNGTLAQNETPYETELKNWIEKEKRALELINVVGKLWLDKSVELVVLRRRIFDNNVSEILNDHLYAKNYLEQPITVDVTLELAQAISRLDIAPARIDMGRLDAEWLKEKQDYSNVDDFVSDKLSDFIGSDKLQLNPRDVVLYGFGRIGRLAARILIEQAGKGQQLRLRAIVTRNNSDEDILKRASLLRKDSVHGKLAGTIVEDLEEKTLTINGQKVHMIGSEEPESIDYTEYGIHNAMIIDNTGVWRDREGLSKHLCANGVDQVLLTAPGKGDLPNLVYGINHESYKDEDNIYSAASCTTNAIVPVLKVVNDQLGIDKGHIETVHAYTNDQNLLDNYHKKSRRGRSAALNMVITETGAAKAVAKVLPELEGKLTGNAVRVPTPDVSLAILHLTLHQATTVNDVNELLKEASLQGDLVEQIEYNTSSELVSSDNIGNMHTAIVDSKATLASGDGKDVTLYVWYDNEYGYTWQVVRATKHLAGVRRFRYY